MKLISRTTAKASAGIITGPQKCMIAMRLYSERAPSVRKLAAKRTKLQAATKKPRIEVQNSTW
ncbi:UNVERIFIED_CONTAM: hypothetical protein Slati_0301100 [Sesamum latifolium]|uniref:Uncharacterized protein n=1 Tax=Sesamum latifolium TaxID=2727402 RepID=A0AAW2YEB5_9LAMI